MKKIGLGIALIAVVVFNSSLLMAQEAKISAKTLKLLTQMAFSHVPEKTTDKSGKEIKIDKSNPDKILIPAIDAVRVIRVAYNSGRAQNCGEEAYQVANYQTMMDAERARKKWSVPQLIFINKLHLMTVMLQTGQYKVAEGGIKNKSEKEVLKDFQKNKPKKKTCSKDELVKMKKDIEKFVFETKKALKKS